MNKIHGIASGSGNHWRTFCGMELYSSDATDEYDTANNDRVECAPLNDHRTVNCVRCRKAIEKAPRGNASLAYHAGLG